MDGFLHPSLGIRTCSCSESMSCVVIKMKFRIDSGMFGGVYPAFHDMRTGNGIVGADYGKCWRIVICIVAVSCIGHDDSRRAWNILPSEGRRAIGAQDSRPFLLLLTLPIRSNFGCSLRECRLEPKIQETAAAMSSQATTSPPVRYWRTKALYPIRLSSSASGKPSCREPM